MKKKPTVSKLKKELDRVFSIFIRQRDDGQCYTCALKKHWKEMQCGHFVPRQYLAVRYDEVNCHCQCYACNCLYNGQPSAFAWHLERDYGVGTVEGLERRRKEITKWTEYDYESKIEYYKRLIN